MSTPSLVLVINCGSSSLKFSLLPRHQDTPLLSGIAEKLGLADASITFKDAAGHAVSQPLAEPGHSHALKVLFDNLRQQG